MTDDTNDKGGDDPEIPLEPFPVHPAASPFPPLAESLPEPTPADPPSDWIETADAHDLAVEHKPERENTLTALGRFAFPPAPPLDDEGLAARDRRWASRAILVATALLLIFHAVSPLDWARQQPPGWVPDTVEKVSGAWVQQLDQLGANGPRRDLRDLWRRAQAARFIGQEPAPSRP
jgi:hypothetical protein